MVAVRLSKSLFSLSLQAVSLVAESLGHRLSKLLLASAVSSVVIMLSSHHCLVSVLVWVVSARVIIAGQVKGSLPSLGWWSAGIVMRDGRGRHGLTDGGAGSGGWLAVAAVATAQGHNIVLLLLLHHLLLLLLLLLERLDVMRRLDGVG